MRRPIRESFSEWWYGWFLLNAIHSGYRTSTPIRRLLILGTAAALAGGISVLCVAVNQAENWRVQEPRGWLPLLFIPVIALVASAFGTIWGLGAGLLASGLTVLSAVADGGALFGTADTVNLLGFVLLLMFLAAGWAYGTDRVRDRPLWQVMVSAPVFPVVFLIALVWLVVSTPGFGGGSGSGTPLPTEPQAVLMYEQTHTDPLARLDQLPADPKDQAWAYQVLSEQLEQGSVDRIDLGRAIDTALEHDWGLRKMTLLLHLDTATEQRLLGGFAAISCGLEPGPAVTLLQAGSATKELAANLSDLMLARQRTGSPDE